MSEESRARPAHGDVVPDARIPVTVQIAGEEHVIRANAEPSYTLRCARQVDARIAEIRARSGPIEGHRAAILAALSLSDELFQLQDELELLDRRVRQLAERLEAGPAGPLPGGAGAAGEGPPS